MRRLLYPFITLLCLSFSMGLFSKEQKPLLKEAFLKAKPGDFVVLSHQKSFSILHIVQVEAPSLTIEEITAPLKMHSQLRGHWQEWLNENAPGHLSWVMYQLNMNSREVQDVYSFSQKSWKKVFPQEQVFPTLMELAFQPIPDNKRKKVGPPLPSEMLDDRPLWQPPIFFQGEKVKKAVCQAYTARWPKDASLLSGKKIEIFLAKEPENIPQYFPMWLHVIDKTASIKLRVLDSGTELTSPHNTFPIPPIELNYSQYTPEGDLIFQLRAHPSLEKLTVYAQSSLNPQSIEIPFEMISENTSHTKLITLKKSDLIKLLKTNMSYHFVFEPEEFLELTVQTPKPLKIIDRHVH